MQNNFPDIVRSCAHLDSQENQIIANYIKEKCKL